MAPNGLEYVVYQPKDLAGAEAKGKLGVYVWGNGGCSLDGASSRFHLTEIASRGYVVIAPGKILSGPKAPPQPDGMRPAGGMSGSGKQRHGGEDDCRSGLDSCGEQARRKSLLRGD